MAVDVSHDSYNLDPQFERLVGVLVCVSPGFYGRIGHSLQLDALKLPEVKIAIKAAHAIAKETGKGPSDPVLVMQRLRRWMDEGTVTYEEIGLVRDMIIDAPDPLPEVDAIVQELAPVIQRRLQNAAVREAMDEYAKRGDFDSVLQLLRKASNIGKQDTSLGTKLGLESINHIAKLRHMERMSLGILELDAIISGGPPRGTLTMFVGRDKSGKSMMLSHTTCAQLRLGSFCAYATLELPEEEVQARCFANLAGIPITSITRGEADDEVAQALNAMAPTLGTLYVKKFPAQATTAPEVAGWVKALEQREQREVDVLIVDYADKLISHDRQDKHDYTAMRTVYEYLRLWAESNGRWCLTASQAQRRAGKDSKRTLDSQDAADSQNKARVVDLNVTINPAEDGTDIVRYYVAGYRFGQGQGESVEVQAARIFGRMGPI